MIEKVAEVIRNGKRFLVTSHLSPDGDAIGSMLALVHLLNHNNKHAVPFHPEPVPIPYQFLEGSYEINNNTHLNDPFDVLVVVDVGERERIAQDLPDSVQNARVLVIDHHQNHGNYGDVVWRQKAAAVGEMIVELARHLSWNMPKEAAECAYTAILTDTGSFRYSSTSASCLETASWLVEKGVQPWKVASHVYETWPDERLRLLGDVLNTLRVTCHGRLASLIVTQDMIEDRNATIDMTEGFVNQGRRIAGVEVAVLFREINLQQYQISFRSRGRIDVAAIASHLGGGGHRNASGATVCGDINSIQSHVNLLVTRALDMSDLNDQQCWSRH